MSTYYPLNISGVSLTIDGTDYSDEFVSMDLSDDSFLGSTVLTTNGTIELAQSPFGIDVDNFIGADFDIGKKVVVDIKQPDGSFSRHPRGVLYITGRNYDFETKIMELDVGCSLSFALNLAEEEQLDALADNFITLFTDSTLVSYLEDNPERNISLLRDLLLAEGSAIYQDQFGYTQKIKIADSINWGSKATTIPYKFTISDKWGLISISPNSDASTEIQTRGVLDYEVYGLNEKNNFVEYKTDQEYDSKNYAGACDPNDVKRYKSSQPTKEVTTNEYQVEDPKYKYKVRSGNLISYSQYTAVKDTTTTTKKYEGVGRQISEEYVEEVSNKAYTHYSSYFDAFADYYSTLTNVPAPWENAAGEFGGTIINSKLTKYKYGTGGQLEKKLEYNYKRGIEAYSTNDAVARISGSNFVGPFFNLQLLATEVETKYEYKADYTKETTTTTEWFDFYEAQRDGATGLQPFVKIETRISGGNLANPEQQDFLPSSLNSNICSPADQETSSDLFFEHIEGPKKNYTLSGSGITQSIPSVKNIDYPLSFRTAKSRQSAEAYKLPLKKFTIFEHIKNNASKYGFTIQLPMLPQLYSYYPSYPFRLALTTENKAYHMAANAVTWSLSKEEAVCSVQGLLIAQLTGITAFNTPTYSNTNYLLPPLITATTANNTTTNQATTLGTTVRLVSSGSTSSVNVTTLPTVTATGSALPTLQGGQFNLKIPVSFTVVDVVGGALSVAASPATISFSVPNTLTVATAVVNFGTIGTSVGSQNFGTILSPSGANLNAGTINAPNF